MKYYIYQIWFPSSEKSYIGQTNNLQKRMNEHLKTGSLICKALWKYDDWQVTILHTTNEELANQLEIEDIRNFNSVAPNGYNLTHGGDGCKGYKHSEKAKEKLRGSKSKETKEKMRVAQIGNRNAQGAKRSKETIKKMSVSAFGNRHTKESKEKMSDAKKGNQNAKGGRHSKATKLKMAIARTKYWLNKVE